MVLESAVVKLFVLGKASIADELRSLLVVHVLSVEADAEATLRSIGVYVSQV